MGTTTATADKEMIVMRLNIDEEIQRKLSECVSEILQTNLWDQMESPPYHQLWHDIKNEIKRVITK